MAVRVNLPRAATHVHGGHRFVSTPGPGRRRLVGSTGDGRGPTAAPSAASATTAKPLLRRQASRPPGTVPGTPHRPHVRLIPSPCRKLVFNAHEPAGPAKRGRKVRQRTEGAVAGSQRPSAASTTQPPDRVANWHAGPLRAVHTQEKAAFAVSKAACHPLPKTGTLARCLPLRAQQRQQGTDRTSPPAMSRRSFRIGHGLLVIGPCGVRSLDA